MRNSISFSFLSFALIGVLSSCADSVEQYEAGTPPSPSTQKQRSLREGLFVPLPEQPAPPVVSQEERIRENSKKDILYGLGAAGVTFQTTLSQANQILSKPTVFTADGIGVYSEGLYIFWREQEPRTPNGFWMDKNYLGSLRAGGNIGDLKMGADLSRYFSPSDTTGKKLIIELYNALEKKDSQFNCLERNLCQIKAFPDYFLYSWAKFGMLLSNDRKLVSDIRLWNKPEQGDLGNNIDILTGTVLIDPTNAQKNVSLGESWKSILNKIGLETQSNTSRNSFSFDFGGIYLGLTKSQFERSYVKPLSEQETLKYIVLANGYNHFIQVGNQYVRIEKDSTSKKLRLRLDPQPPQAQEKALRLQVNVSADDQIPFVRQLTELLKKELSQKHPHAQVHVSLSGLHSQEFEKSYEGSVTVYDSKTDESKSIDFGFSTTSGNFSYFQVVQLVDPVNSILLPEYFKGISLQAKVTDQLSGIHIGQEVQLMEIDRGRDEATLQVTLPQGSPIKTRVSYSKYSTQKGIYSQDGKTITESVEKISMGDLPITLALKTEKHPDIPGGLTGKVVGITSSQLLSGVSGVCGISSLKLQVNTKTADVLTQINQAIEEKKKTDPQFECLRFSELDSNGSREITALYFPNQRLKLIFSGRELRALSVYSRVK